MRCDENSLALSFSLRPVLMTGIVTPLIIFVPLCRGFAADLNLAVGCRTLGVLPSLRAFQAKYERPHPR
jgi:hypothetical protein